LKLDAKGRVKSTAEQREAVLREFKRSGLSGPRFAAVAGINYQTFAVWMRKARQQTHLAGAQQANAAKPEPGPPGAGIRWVEAVMAESHPRQADDLKAGSEALRVSLPGGVLVEITQLGQVALAVALLRAMEGGARPC